VQDTFSHDLHRLFHMASIKPHPSGGFRAFVCVNGIRESKVLKGKREAQQWAAQRETELAEACGKAPSVRYTLADVLGKYRDEVSPHKRGARWEAVRIGAFLHMLHMPMKKQIGAVTTEDMAIWRDARLKEVSPGTVLREIALLSAVFECCRREWKWITANPLADMRKPKEPEHRDTIITLSQIRKMLVAMKHSKGPCKRASQAAARAFLLALRTGMRAGEITGLTWDRVKADYCILPVTKTTRRNVPLEPRAKRVIESMRGWDDDLVFGLAPQTLGALFRRYRDRAGLSGFTFHDSRHTAATRLASRLDVLTLCKMFGWKSTSQALTYFNPSASDIAKRLS